MRVTALVSIQPISRRTLRKSTNQPHWHLSIEIIRIEPAMQVINHRPVTRYTLNAVAVARFGSPEALVSQQNYR